VEGVDDDLDIGNLMRLNEHQTRHRLHRFQHLYVWVLYSLFYVSWIFFSDYNRYFSKHIGSVPIGRMKPTEHIKFWVGKLLNIALYIVIPIVFVGWGKWLIGFPLVTFTTGVATALVFQLAHTVEGPEFPLPNAEANMLPDEFAIHQIATTANFATNSRLVTWLVGGLNFQIEHHLFPGISHVHYPAISKVVRQVCLERDIDYVEHKTFGKAVAAHIRHLHSMGRASAIAAPAHDTSPAEGCISVSAAETT
jgi:linoleoyl-CoA desaturase